MDITLLYYLLPLIVGLLGLYLLSRGGRQASVAIKNNPTPGATLESPVFWKTKDAGINWAGGRLVLKERQLILISEQGEEVFSALVSEVKLDYISNSSGFYVETNTGSYWVRLYTGIGPVATFKATKIYSEWDEALRQAGSTGLLSTPSKGVNYANLFMIVVVSVLIIWALVVLVGRPDS